MTLSLTNLDKVFWKKEKFTKGDMLNYYATVAPYMLPYLKDRPLMLHRYPEGIEGEDFYQKEAPKPIPRFVKTATIQHTEKKITYIVVQNAKTLLYVANLGSIEFHPFSSTIKKINYPDYMVLDLDPENISFNSVVDTANALHEILEEIEAPHFCKTSGARGLHIYVPLRKKYDYDQSQQFAFLIATIAHERLPRITSLERMPKKRQKRVYIDSLQNFKGQTLVAPYSIRGRPHAPVSTPLLWKEVKYGLDPTDFNIETLPKRLTQKGDIFKGILGKGIHLSSCLKKLEKML